MGGEAELLEKDTRAVCRAPMAPSECSSRSLLALESSAPQSPQPVLEAERHSRQDSGNVQEACHGGSLPLRAEAPPELPQRKWGDTVILEAQVGVRTSNHFCSGSLTPEVQACVPHSAWTQSGSRKRPSKGLSNLAS